MSVWMIVALVAAAYAAGIFTQWLAEHRRREDANRAEEKATWFAEASNRMYDQLDMAGRLLSEKERLIKWLAGAVHDQADKLRRAPTFASPHTRSGL